MALSPGCIQVTPRLRRFATFSSRSDCAQRFNNRDFTAVYPPLDFRFFPPTFSFKRNRRTSWHRFANARLLPHLSLPSQKRFSAFVHRWTRQRCQLSEDTIEMNWPAAAIYREPHWRRRQMWGRQDTGSTERYVTLPITWEGNTMPCLVFCFKITLWLCLWNHLRLVVYLKHTELI